MRALRRSIFPLFASAWLAGWILGDCPPPLLWLYFIPAPVVAGYGVIDGLARIRRASPARTVATFSFALLAGIKTAAVDTRWNAHTPAPPHALRVVHWNIAYVKFGFVPLLQSLAGYRPDLVVFSEARHSQDIPFFSDRELGLPHTYQTHGMILLSRYPFVYRGRVPIADGYAWAVRLETPWGELDVVCADILSHPAINRTAALAPLARWLAAREEAVPLMLIGDFNTPRDSRAFRDIRKHVRHAYEAAGRGWPYTWPVPVPLYAIDHAWLTPDITVHRYRLRTDSLSDHRRQVFEISLPPRERIGKKESR